MENVTPATIKGSKDERFETPHPNLARHKKKLLD